MTRTIEVEIDDSGRVGAMDPANALPHGRALLVWQTEPMLDPVSRAIANAQLIMNRRATRSAVAESKAWLAAPPGQTISHAGMTTLLLASALAVDWLRPEEDEAWTYMQSDR